MRQDLAKYFKKEKDSILFVGDKLEVIVPERYGSYGALEIGDDVSTLAVFDMVINGTIKTGMLCPAKITMFPTEYETMTKGSDKYYKIILYKDDIFMTSTKVIRNEQMAYVMFNEFVISGKRPDFINYKNSPFMFDDCTRISGVKFRSPHFVFEMIDSHQYRDKNKVNVPYRNTDMKESPVVIPLRAVEHAAISSIGRLVGSYLDTGINAVLVNAGEESEVENVLRA